MAPVSVSHSSFLDSVAVNMSGSRRGNTSNPLFRNRNNAFAPIAQVVPLLSSTYRTVDLQLVVVQLFLIRWRKIRKRRRGTLIEKWNAHCMDFSNLWMKIIFRNMLFSLRLFLRDFQNSLTMKNYSKETNNR